MADFPSHRAFFSLNEQLGQVWLSSLGVVGCVRGATMAPAAFRISASTQVVQQQRDLSFVRHAVSIHGGIQVCLRELLARADDAKAQHFVVCLDKQQYNSARLLSPGMQALQGPALVIGSDARSSNLDKLTCTKRTGHSTTAAESDTSSRFGHGALSLYSASDVVQHLSGDELHVSDPHATHLDRLSAWRCNFADASSQNYVDLSSKAPGQLEPFIGVTQSCAAFPAWEGKSSYPWTLFRLSLRTEDAAAASQISQQHFNADECASMLEDFASAAADLLLCLQHVQKISVYVKEGSQNNAVLLHQSNAEVVRDPVGQQSLQQQLVVNSQHADGSTACQTWAKIGPCAKHGSGIAVFLKDNKSDERLPVIAGKNLAARCTMPMASTGLPFHVFGAFMLSSDGRSLNDAEAGKVRPH